MANCIENILDVSNIIKVDVKMKEEDYLASMITDLDRRASDLGYTIKWNTYGEFVNMAITSGVHEDSNLSKDYCEYIDKYAKYVYFLEQTAILTVYPL
jgi:hypothetical protein